MQNRSTKSTEKQLYIRIEPAEEREIALNSLIKVLNAVNTAFENFIYAEVFSRYSEQTAALKKELKQLLAESKLFITGFDFNSFTLIISVDSNPSKNKYRVLTNLPELKKELFHLFNNTVFTTDLFEPDYVEKLIKKYSSKARISIFKPVYNELINKQDFVIYFKNEQAEVDNQWQETDDKAILSRLIPEPVKKVKDEVESYYQLVKTGEESDLFGRRSKYKKVLITETLKHDLYPYQVQKLKVNGKEVIFSRQLTATVSVKNGLYQIAFPELKISVQNERRENAEKAFNADLAALINRFEKGNWNSADAKAQILFFKLKEFIAEL